MTITLCVLLWAVPGRADRLAAYEDTVLDLLPEHRGRLLERVRTEEPADDDPTEVQLIEFADDDAFESYLGDERRQALAAERDAAIARTDVLRVRPVTR